jgi:hypothetical protein
VRSNCPAWARTRNERSKVSSDADFTTGHFLGTSTGTESDDHGGAFYAQLKQPQHDSPLITGGSKDIPPAGRFKMPSLPDSSTLSEFGCVSAFNSDVFCDRVAHMGAA